MKALKMNIVLRGRFGEIRWNIEILLEQMLSTMFVKIFLDFDSIYDLKTKLRK